MQRLILFLFSLSFYLVSSQTLIKGRVTTSTNYPIENASIYINNSSIGTTSNKKGQFELLINDGIFDLIISHVSFQTIQYKIDAKSYSKPIHFQTIPKNNVLNEVVISNNKSKISKEDRLYFLSRFRNSFIGKSNFARNCKIENLDALKFYYDKETKVLNAQTKEPLRIINKYLGYECFYDLVEFELDSEKQIYLGFTRFKELKGSKRKQKKWKANRLIAFNGSTTHFLRTLKNKTLIEEGFLVNQFKRIPNPKRPSDSLLKEARNYIKSMTKKGVSINFFKKTDKPETKLDSAMIVLKNAKLKKHNDVVYKENLTFNELTETTDEGIFLSFENYIYVKYLNEKEEYNYRLGANRLNYQQSILYLLNPKAKILELGVLEYPLDAMVEEYWSYEKFANTLPLDYFPE